MKILIAGQEGGSSSVIRDALNIAECDIQLINFDHLIKGINGKQADLFILNFTDFSDTKPSHINHILAALKNISQPILSFVTENQEVLRSILQESGIAQIIDLPYSHSETRLLIENLLESVSKSTAKFGFPTQTTITLSESEFLIQLIHLIFQQGNNLSDLFEFLLDFLYGIPKKSTILLFEIKKTDQGTLIDARSNRVITEKETFRVSELFESEDSLANIELLKNLGRLPKKQAYLKSKFGIHASTIFKFPIFKEKNLRYLILVLSEESLILSKEQLKMLESARQLVEIKLRVMDLQAVLQNRQLGVGKENFQFFQSVVDQFNFGIIIFNKVFEIKYINKEGKRLLQVQNGPNSYDNLKNILGEQNTTAIINSMRVVNSAYQRPEIEITTPGGQRLLIGFTLTEFTDPLSDEGYILSLKDITYTKELQEEILRMDRLASLGVMASGIAHEIRNPLAGIKAIAQTFEDELDKTDPKNEYVKRIIKQVNRLDEMLKSLFSYAKPPKPNRQFFHIKELMQDVLSLLKRKIQSQNIKLVQSYDKEIPPVFVDNSQIQQVIFNLLLNGIEAIDKNGEISIKSSRVDPHQEFFQRKPFFKKFTENPFVLIAIRDNGCGITPENLQQIFNPFFTTKNFGTGLGLSIVYQIVQENNGIIYYESKVGEGTECFLFLPAFEPAKLSKH